MGFRDGLKKQKDGSFILSHKSKEAKEGDCIVCGQNPKSRMLLFKYKSDDLILVREYMSEHLSTYSIFLLAVIVLFSMSIPFIILRLRNKR